MEVDAAYGVLGLGPDAEIEVVRAAYRRLVSELHPDHLGGDRSTEERLARVTEAYRVIRDAPPPAPAGLALEEDDVAFSIEQLPVEAIETLYVACSVLGDVLDVEEPYRLVASIQDPGPCWCVLTLVPEAGGSIVTVHTKGRPQKGRVVPSTRDVALALVREATELLSGPTGS